jgi:hypothetical protein
MSANRVSQLVYNDLTNWRLSRPLRIGVVPESPPFMFECAQYDLKVRRPTCVMPGIAVEMMHFLMTSLRFDYELVQLNVSAGAYGSPGPNGTWIGEPVRRFTSECIVQATCRPYTPVLSIRLLAILLRLMNVLWASNSGRSSDKNDLLFFQRCVDC